MDGDAHTYGLVDELVAPVPQRDRGSTRYPKLNLRRATGHPRADVPQVTDEVARLAAFTERTAEIHLV